MAWGAMALAVLCLIAAGGIDGGRARRAAVASAAEVSLGRLALLAGLVDDQGRPTRDEPFEVVIAQEGGPRFVGDGVRDALRRQRAFVEGDGHHLLRAQAALGTHAMSLQLRLWRQGWDVRGPEPVRLHFAPWIAFVAGLLGAAITAAVRRFDIGVLAAGVSAQLAVQTLPRPRPMGYGQGDATAWAHSPAVEAVRALLAADTAVISAVLLAVLATCLVLVAFDHRRSAAREDGLGLNAAVLSAVAFSAGALGWIEAAGRTSLGAVVSFPMTLLALAALVGTWVLVGAARTQRRPRG